MLCLDKKLESVYKNQHGGLEGIQNMQKLLEYNNIMLSWQQLCAITFTK